MPLTTIAFWVVYVGGVVAAFVNPVVGLGLYILVYHLAPETQWWGGSFAALGMRTSFIVALATGIGSLVQPPPRLAPCRQFPFPYLLMLCLGVLSLLSLTWAIAIEPRGLYYIEKFIKLMTILFILLRCVRTPENYQFIFLAWLLGVAYLAYQATGGVGGVIGGRLTYGLGGPDFAESSGLAVHLVATLPLIGALFFMVRRWWTRILVLGLGAITCNTIIMTQTRNVLAGLAVMAPVTALALPRGYRIRGVLSIVAGTILAITLTDGSWWERMMSVKQYEADLSVIGRLHTWAAVFRVVADYPMGVGIGNFYTIVEEYTRGPLVRSPHNTLLMYLADLGWLGLGLFLFLLAALLSCLMRTRRIAQTLPAFTTIRVLGIPTRFHLCWHVLALLAGILGYLGCAMFTNRFFAEDLWLLFGMVMCLHNIARAMAADHEQHPAGRAATSTLGSGDAPAALPPTVPEPACG